MSLATTEEGSPATVKPSLRGMSHLIAFGVSLLAGPLLVVRATNGLATTTAIIYSVCLSALFGCSALLHRRTWSETGLPWARRLDHSTIFVFIAGTYTPITALTLSARTAQVMLIVVWTGAVAGVVITIFWLDAPRWTTAACYVVVGWTALGAIPALWSALGPGQFGLLVAGGVLFTAGSVVYARKTPDPFPLVFGYHEVFHALVIAAVVCHYVLIARLVRN